MGALQGATPTPTPNPNEDDVGGADASGAPTLPQTLPLSLEKLEPDGDPTTLTLS